MSVATRCSSVLGCQEQPASALVQGSFLGFATRTVSAPGHRSMIGSAGSASWASRTLAVRAGSTVLPSFTKSKPKCQAASSAQ
jgi:hypothetical protein